MVQYRRNRISGGTFFFTVTLRDRRSAALVENINALRQAFRITLSQRPFKIDAIVVLPDHLHTIWTLPHGDDDYPGRWRSIKGRFTHTLAATGVPLRRNAKGDYNLWQRRYWEHTIRNEADLSRHVDYIHFNPVKHGWAERVQDWPHSSFHRFVRAGLYPADWAGGGLEYDEKDYGE